MKKLISALSLFILIPSFAFAFTFERYLTNGSSGSDVTALQEFLAQQGDFTVQPTGYFGPVTAQALASFQRSQHLSPIGSIDAETRAALNLMAGGISVPTPVTTQANTASATYAVSPADVGGASGSFSRPLEIGSSGSDVTLLQQILAGQGFFSVAPTGYFGPVTAASVSAFQSAHGLDAVGFVGPLTRALLNTFASSAGGGSSVSLPTIATPSTLESTGANFSRALNVGSTGSDVSELQQFLKNQGYFSGDVTGFFGAVTSAAVAQFQTANGIDSVGFVGPKTLTLLNQFLSNVTSRGNVAIPSQSGGADSDHGFGGGGGGGGYSSTPSSGGGGSTSSAGGSGGGSVSSSSSGTGSGSNTEGGGSTSGGSSNGNGNSGSGGSTQTDTTPPAVAITLPDSNLAAGTTQTTLAATTNENATCSYSTSATFAFANGTLLSGSGSHTHTATLIGLSNGTSYAYYVKCSDTAGNISGNASVTFTVANPVVSLAGWANVAFAAQTGTFTAAFDVVPQENNEDETVGLSASSASAYTDLAAIVRFNDTGTIDVRDGDGYAFGKTISYTAGQKFHVREVVNIPAHTYSVYITPPGGSETLLASNYSFRTEQASVASLSNYAKFSSISGDDATISNFTLSAGVTSAPTVALSASPSSITSGGSSILTYSSANTTSCVGSNFSASGISGSVSVSPTKTTTYTVSCTGAGGSAMASATVTISAASDTAAPSTPSGLTAAAVSASAVNLSWNASTDNVGVTGYNIYRGGTKIGTSAANSFSDSGLSASTAYSYTVSAYDAAGNTSPQSGSASATTQAIVSGSSCPKGTAYADGCNSAAAGSPVLPGILSGYVVRPPWNVAGVDFAVGVPSGTTLKDPTTSALPSGCSYSSSAHTVTCSGTVTLDGYDFGLHNGVELILKSGSATVQNSKFVVGSNEGPSATVLEADGNTALTFLHNEVDGANVAGAVQASATISLSNGGTTILRYNYFHNSGGDMIDIGNNPTAQTEIFQYNVFRDIGLLVDHSDTIQWCGALTKSPSDISFNLVYQSKAGLSGNGLLVPYAECGGTISGVNEHNNTLISKVNDNFATGVIVAQDAGPTTGDHVAIFDNYTDPTGIMAFTGSPWYPTGSYGTAMSLDGSLPRPTLLHDLIDMTSGTAVRIPTKTNTAQDGWYVYPDATGYTPSLNDVYSVSASPSSGSLASGQVVTFTLNMAEPWTVSGSPTLSLSSGGTATYTSGSGSSALVFSYTVAPGQSATNLAVTGFNANGASIKDAYGNSAAMSGLSSTFTGLNISGSGGGADTTAPSTPTNLSASAVSSSQINLTWTASTDNVGVTGYNIYRGGTKIGTSATNSYSNTGLSASTAYSYTVSAYDAAGNTSPKSGSASATTQAAQQVDTTPPTVTVTAPSGQLASGTTQTTLSVTTNENATCAWSNTQGTAFASMTAFTTTGGTSHSTALTGLANGSSYITYVECKDTSGNISSASTASFSVASSGTAGGSTGGGSYDDTTHWPSASNRPVYNPATKVLTWIGPVNGGPSTSSDVQQSKTLVVSAPITTSHDGQVIDGVAILNDGGGYVNGIDVKNNNVTIRDCYVKGNPLNLANIYIEPGVTGTVIEDCELDGAGNTNSSGTFNVMGDPMTNATIRRNNMHDAEQMVSRTMQNVTITDNYMHDVQGQDADMVEIYVDQGNSFNIAIKHNTFWQTVASPGFNSAINMSNWVSPNSISGVTIDNNRFVVPDFPHVFCDDNRQGTGTVKYSATNNGFINTIKAVQTGDNNGVSPNSGNYILTSTSDTDATGAPFNGNGQI